MRDKQPDGKGASCRDFRFFRNFGRFFIDATRDCLHEPTALTSFWGSVRSPLIYGNGDSDMRVTKIWGCVAYLRHGPCLPLYVSFPYFIPPKHLPMQLKPRHSSGCRGTENGGTRRYAPR